MQFGEYIITQIQCYCRITEVQCLWENDPLLSIWLWQRVNTYRLLWFVSSLNLACLFLIEPFSNKPAWLLVDHVGMLCFYREVGFSHLISCEPNWHSKCSISARSSSIVWCKLVKVNSASHKTWSAKRGSLLYLPVSLPSALLKMHFGTGLDSSASKRGSPVTSTWPDRLAFHYWPCNFHWALIKAADALWSLGWRESQAAAFRAVVFFYVPTVLPTPAECSNSCFI